MKKIYTLLVAFLFCFLMVNAQGIYQLWGTTSGGGASHQGVIFTVDSVGNNFQQRFQFNAPSTGGGNPRYTELKEYNNKFYGMTEVGGATTAGVILEWDPATNVYSKKIDFPFASNPKGSLTLYGGKFYGMIYDGDNTGSIFEWDPGTNVYLKKIDLNRTIGDYPYGSLTLNGGKFYGMTLYGGSNDVGVIFEWDPATNIYTKKIDLDLVNGRSPLGDLTLSGGKFFGMTNYGGSNDQGVIFEWDPATNIYSKKIDLNASIGSYPTGSLTINGGKFYGTTYGGGINNEGVIFEWDPATNIYTKKVDLDFTTGSSPSNIIFNNGKFYGCCALQGSFSGGVLYEWDPVTNIYNKKIDLNPSNDGKSPQGSLALKGGKYYGMTNGGGTNDQGVIFEWDPTTNIYTKKIDFIGTIVNTNGASPVGSLTPANGKFYGITNGGGIYNKGVIYEWDPSANNYTKKIDFDSANGGEPQGSLTIFNGKIYGMTLYGGSNNTGVIFEWDPVTNGYTKKIDLITGIDGGPTGNLTLSGTKLYGTTVSGGINDAGVIFEWDPATNIYTKKIDMDSANGAQPFGSLTLKNGKFYGTTGLGGSSDEGVIFEWDPATNVYTKKLDFVNATGSLPFGNLTLAGNKLYGLTSTGGNNNYGVIFEWDPTTNIYIKKFDFDSINGNEPHRSLTLNNGKLYGMTSFGGTFNEGVIFQWDPSTNIFTKKKDFNGTDGATPYANDFSTLPATVASGVANTCTAFPSITIDNTNNNVWVPILDSLGNAVAEIKANGNNLGVSSTSMYINSGPVREDSNKQLYLDRNVTITPTVQPSTAVDIRLYLKGSEFEALKNALNSQGQPSGVNTIDDVEFFKNSQGCSATQSSTAPVTVTGASWNGADYVLTASITGFSSFYVANKNNVVLPLSLLEFSGKLLNKTAALNWKTDNEINTLSFDIERSNDGITYTSIGTVAAANQPGIHQYNYTDNNLIALGAPVVYYRLKQKSMDGSSTYSSTVVLLIDKTKSNVFLYPNPVINRINLDITVDKSVPVQCRITDITGKIIKHSQLNLSAGNNSLSINVKELAKGNYFLELKGDNIIERKQFNKQ